MPQKPVLKAGKKIVKQQAANKHGKGSNTRKGKLEKPPKKAKDLEAYREDKELTKVINATNEANFATIAQNKGGRLKTLKGAPPAMATKHAAAKAKAAKKEAAKGKGAAAAAADKMQEDDDDEEEDE